MTTALDPVTGVRADLWKAILAKVDEIKRDDPGNGGAVRSRAFYSSNDDACMATLTVDQADGTRNVYVLTAHTPPRFIPHGQITVTVARSHTSNEELWQPRADKQDPRAVIVGDRYYTVGPENAPGAKDCRGFGGRRFVIEHLRTGEQTITTNLWFVGVIPPRFRVLLADSHRFVTDEEATPGDGTDFTTGDQR